MAEPKVVDLKTGEEHKTPDKVDEIKWPDKGFPPDWRERSIAMMELKGEEATKEMERLKKFGSPAEVTRSSREAASKIQQLTDAQKGLIKLPGKDAKPEEIDAYRKAIGVPDKPEEYLKVLPARPKELGERDPADVELLKVALPVFHAKNFTPDQITTMVQAMDQAEAMMRSQTATVSKTFDKESSETLRVEWNGKGQFDKEVEVANRAAKTLFGDFVGKSGTDIDVGSTGEFFNLTLDNGRKLGSYPAIVKAFNRLGKEGFDAVDTDDLPEIGETVGAADLDAEIKKITSLAHTGKSADEAQYKALQPRLEQLTARKTRMAGKA